MESLLQASIKKAGLRREKVLNGAVRGSCNPQLASLLYDNGVQPNAYVGRETYFAN